MAMVLGSGPGSPEAQSVMAMLNSLDAESAVAAISQVLTAKPELAPAIVGFAVPDLTYAPSRAFTERRAKGVVKQYNKLSGFGFIECPELHAVFGKDVFVHARQLSSFEIGAEVTFAVVLNKDNKPQAVDLLSLDGKGCDGKAAGKGMGDVGKGKNDCWGKGVGDGGKGKSDVWNMLVGVGGKSKSDGWGKGGKEDNGGKLSTAKPDEQATLGQFTGFIKSFNNKNGYGFGFIQSEGMKTMGYTNDVYLHHLQLNGCEVMQEVSFVAYLNKKSQPQARDVVPLGPPPSQQGFGAPVQASWPSALEQGFGAVPCDQQGWSAVPPSVPAPVLAPTPVPAPGPQQRAQQWAVQLPPLPVVPHVPVRAEFIDPLAQQHLEQQHLEQQHLEQQQQQQQQFAAVEGYGAEASQAYGDGLWGQQAGYCGAAESHVEQAQPLDASPSVASLLQQMDQTQWSSQQIEPFALGHPFAGEGPEAKRQRLEQQGW